MGFLFSLACWAAAVGALAGSIFALVVGDGHTAWALVWAAAVLGAVAMIADAFRKAADRW
jgi:hypothetical protein